ncbi:unnamed protein product [Vitrella brassicaformis CCMP3155]|uniref:Heat shock protein 70 n=2 Tax=Vitrella brassicaformis TaxID=1169539 RepID=A0A0G4EGG5_VITBC|nr:unnamed protein product [Vitrella brassicaformis CCMP3155]|mmetsp:Transcript_34828/g.100275  ORF Transcript_34828/g.100275 Transcript_34828/m.100275 type:complete len:532 (-) Transcript_34828:3439-5034(-)|eukprot:CEL94499.1 unnamed protein product [Vitrella brassicaformis CCMP3155]
MAAGGPAIGIDLGTTHSRVAVFQNNTAKLITNAHDDPAMPSCVAFTKESPLPLIGEAAKQQQSNNLENTIFAVKRLIGRSFDDPSVQSALKYWPFKVMRAKGGKPIIEVTHQHETKGLLVEDVTAMVLTKLKNAAEAPLGTTVKNAVISVPGHFNHAQRQAVKDAATMSGLNVMRIMSDHGAAAIATHWLDKTADMGTGERNVLILDMGGGTCDVTLLTAHDGVFDVRATAGVELGGEDIDSRLVDFCVEDFMGKNVGTDPTTDRQAMSWLRAECDKAKLTLSTGTEFTIEIKNLFQGIDYAVHIPRARFEDLCAGFFRKVLLLVDKVLRDDGMDKEAVHDVVLVGGSTRIPKIQELITDYFGGRAPIGPIADGALARGAAVMAALLCEDPSVKLQPLILLDVMPISVGVETAGGVMAKIVERDTTLPTKKTCTFGTHLHNQTKVLIQVYEGEGTMTAENNLLCSFYLKGIKPASRGQHIQVTFDIDTNGTICVDAQRQTDYQHISANVNNLFRVGLEHPPDADAVLAYCD